MSGSAEIRRFLLQQDDSMGRQAGAGNGGVPTQRGSEPPRISDDQVHRAQLAVARSAQDADDCKLLLEMLGLTPGENGHPAVND